ncbi:RNA polymerase sigma factor [Actinoallomurus spadix]|uniref:Sigma-70 family RNA polymerase sigma factor n=1 Tax=Actinoallomurus spadix TaxID=79912 RepID=A0ABP3HKV6_9ACTN|nr:sigma-70 family RNA polymerase sigma factor [Actinoallomurus spadix]MCO5990477.1 RNA polymerase sigma factor [Actinoallomurus spadix]
MAGWPSIDRAEDQRLARALDAGDTNAIPQLYAAYAARLFDYCNVLLRDQDTAAQTVHDTLIAVQGRIAALPDPRLFRAWLYATARGDCLRRLSHGELPAERRRAPETELPGGLDPAAREFLAAAFLVLSARQREALDLLVRHELDPHELSEVLETTPQEVSALIEQARSDLDDAFAAVVVAATGRDDCPTVPTLAGPPGEHLDTERCRELARHIAGCPICALRVNGRVGADRMLRGMPVTALPENLRGRVLATAFSPEHAQTRAAIALRFAPPPPEPPAEKPRRKVSPVLVAGAAATGAVLVLSGFLLVSSGSDGPGDQRAAGSSGPAAAPSESSTDDGAMTSPSADSSPTPRTSTPTPTPSATPTPTPTPTPSRHRRTAHPTRHPGSPARTPSRSAPHPPQSGTLVVSGCDMGYGYQCSITLYADGGSVRWAVTATDGVSTGGSGYLAAGTSTSLTVTRSDRCWRGVRQGSVTFSSGAVAYVTYYCSR